MSKWQERPSIPVKVIKKTGRRYLLLRWIDPKTGEPRQLSSKTVRRREAETKARQLERDLLSGMVADECGWLEFCERYHREHLRTLKAKSAENWGNCRRSIAKLMKPDTVHQIDASFISSFATKLRESVGANGKPRSEATIKSYLVLLRAALGWARDMEIIDRVPNFRMPKRAKGKSKTMRSRPVTGEEFDRIIAKAEIVRPKDYRRWQYLMNGLWLSGFRVEELLNLSWDDGSEWSINSLGRRPCIQLLASGEKANTDRTQPITKDFWDLLCETPEDHRFGRAFKMTTYHRNRERQMSTGRVIRIISDIGSAAGVITDATADPPKCATSSDIGRRAFATRLGGQLSQAELAKWMRHKSPKTTMDYYYHRQTAELQDKVWDLGDTLGDTTPTGGDEE